MRGYTYSMGYSRGCPSSNGKGHSGAVKLDRTLLSRYIGRGEGYDEEEKPSAYPEEAL